MNQKKQKAFRAYFDESGTHGSDSPLCVMAGFVGSTVAWNTFERLWVAIGRDANDIGFHAKDFFRTDSKQQRVGEYKGWSDERANHLISGIVNAVTASRVHPVVVAVDLKAFSDLMPPERYVLTRGRENAYFMVFELAILQSTERIKRQNWTVDFIFDRNQTFEPGARALYSDLEREPDKFSRRMGALDFQSSRSTHPLQAADLLAHCWYQLRSDAAARRLTRIRPVMERWTSKDYEGHLWSKDTFDKAFGRAPRTQGDDYEVRISESGRYSIQPARE